MEKKIKQLRSTIKANLLFKTKRKKYVRKKYNKKEQQIKSRRTKGKR